MAICPVSRFCAINFTDGECAVDPDLRLEFGSPGRAGHEALGAGGPVTDEAPTGISEGTPWVFT